MPRRLALAFLCCSVNLLRQTSVHASVVDVPPVADCPAGNLLAGARPTANSVRSERLGQLFDGRVAPAGAAWPDPKVLVALHGDLELDVGAPVPAGLLFLQIDADQPAVIGTSADGVEWDSVRIPADQAATGMISRVVQFPPRSVRYLRLGATDPTHVLAASELGLFCDPHHDVNRDLRVVVERASPRASREEGARGTTVTDIAKLAIALLAFVAALVAMRGRRIPVAGAAFVAAVALAAYTGFGAYHHQRFVHNHDVFHYFVGAKYFPQLGYDRLYACASVAEADAGFPQRAGLRPARDLVTNHVVRGTDLLGRAAECHGAFTEAGWREYSGDVRIFATAAGVLGWNRALKDHGFNASPVWIATARSFGRFLRASSPVAIGWGKSPFGGFVAALDPVLLAIAFAVATWAMGPLTASVGAVVFACNPLAEFSWIGGGFLRQLWFCTLVVGISLLHRRRWIPAGVALGVATSLQLFPAVCLVGLAGYAIAHRLRSGVVHSHALRALVAAMVTVAVAVPLSAWGSGRNDAWSTFVANTEKHAATPAANTVGLPAALSFRMATRASVLFDPASIDAHARVRQARLENYGRVRVLHWLGIALGALLFTRHLRRGDAEPWEATGLALALVPLFIDLSSYYTEWLVALVLAGWRAPRLVLTVLSVVMAELVVKLILADADSDLVFAASSWVLTLGAIAALAITRYGPLESISTGSNGA